MKNIESNDLLLSYDGYEIPLESRSPYLKYHSKPTLLLQHCLEKDRVKGGSCMKRSGRRLGYYGSCFKE